MRRSLPVLFFWAALGRLLWAQTYDSTVVTVRTGCFPMVVFPGETFVFRFDYLAGSAVDTVYIPQDFDWSPLEVVGYRYIMAVEDGSRSLQVILRIPDTPEAWNRDFVVFKSLPIRWRLHDGKEKEEEKSCSVSVATKYIYYTSPDGGSVYEDRSAGSWHLINRGVRDNTVLPIARGAGYLIFGLDTRLVKFTFWDAPWVKEKQTFKVWVEGPLLLYHVDLSVDSTDFGFVRWQYSYFSEEKYFKFNLIADTFKTDLVPYHAPYVPRNLENSWRLFVLPRPEAQNGSRGKIVAAFYRGSVELFRRELNFYVYGDILKNNIILTPIYKDTTLSGDWYTVGCVGYNSDYSDVCREIYYKNWCTYSYLNSGNLYINYRYDQGGFLTIESFSSFQYDRSAILNYTTYFQSLDEKIQYYLEPIQRASPCDPFYEVVKCESQGNSTVAVYRFRRDLKTETHRENFYAVFKQSAKVAFELGDIPPEDPYRDRIPPVQYSLATSYFLGQLNYNKESTGIPEFTIVCRYPQEGQATCALGEIINDFEPVYRQYTVKSGDYGFETYNDRDIIFWHGYGDIFGKKGQLFNWPPDLSEPPEDTSSTQPIEIRLLANPSVQRLQDLTGSLNDRRPFEFIVQVYQNGQPLANTPLTVEGPFADDEIPSTDALLLLNEPQQTNAFGIYSFSWIPPSGAWFEGKSMPYGFRFRVRVGDTWEDATVQVSNLIRTYPENRDTL